MICTRKYNLVLIHETEGKLCLWKKRFTILEREKDRKKERNGETEVEDIHI